MDDLYEDHLNGQTRPQPPQESPPLPPPSPSEGIIETKPQTPEQIIAETVSQKLLSSVLETSPKPEEESEDLSPNIEAVGHSYGEPIIEEPIHQDFEFQSEHRFSGHPIQQYIYDEEEEDEELDNEVDIDLIKDTRSEPSKQDLLTESTQKPEEDVFMKMSTPEQKEPKEEILYQLSDDNVLTEQKYGYGTDLRIGSISSEPKAQEMSLYELDSEDPFGTPHKQMPARPDSTEKDFERFVDKCEPFETISGDNYHQFETNDEPIRASINLLDLDQSIAPTLTEPVLSVETIVKQESHSMVEQMPDSQPEPNHALSATSTGVDSEESTEVLPSSVVDTDIAESQFHFTTESTNRRDTDLSPNVSPNLDSFEPTLQPSDHHFEDIIEQVLPSQIPPPSPPKPVDTIKREEQIEHFVEEVKEQAIATQVPKPSKPFEPETEVISKTMSSAQESEPAVSTSSATASSGGQCPGFGAWFNPSQLNPTVAELVYWRDPKKTGIVFGSGLVILLSLTFFSIISVVAYTSLATLSVTLSFRIYKNILQAVQKTNEGHPFKEYLEVEITPSSERIHEIVDSVVAHMNCTINKLRSVFLVEDIIDSLKFAVLFWCLTYIGSWFNGLTLVILAYLGLFSLPKVYEMNKTQIDQYLSLASAQINDITSKIRAKIPFPAKKDKEN